MKLRISDTLSLPLEAVTQTFAILAKRGVGKTHTASVMAEEMLKNGQPIVVYDPTGAWFGLKSSKDGKHAGFPVVVFGGEHADVPLEETAGNTIANVIVEKRFPAILDCSLLRKNARIRFMTDFCETLYHKNREALHFFVDEAQTVAPQNVKKMPEAARLLGAMEDIVMQGRRRGLGLTIISPRPAVVNTNLRSACEVIIAMQIIGPHDRKAISEWIDLHGDDEQKATDMLESLASLKRGQAWIWSPSWLGLFKRVEFRDRETFDSSATPEVGHKAAVPKKMAEVDLASLGEQIKATVERAKSEDPKELRKKIAEQAKRITDLEKQLAEKPAEQVTETKIEYVDKPVLKNGQMDKAANLVDRIAKLRDELSVTCAPITEAFAKVVAGPAVIPPKAGFDSKKPDFIPRTPRIIPEKPRNITRPADSITAGPGELVLDKAARLILAALAQYPHGRTSHQIALLTGYSPSSLKGPLANLREHQAVTMGQPVQITQAGLDALGPWERLPTGRELADHWLAKLPKAESLILRALLEVHPSGLTSEEMAARLNYSASSLKGPLAYLRGIELVTMGQPVRASGEFFQ